jgi:uncharacterized protein (TIRG00374 family)
VGAGGAGVRPGPRLVVGANFAVAAVALGWMLHRFGGDALRLLGERHDPVRLLWFAGCVAGAVVILALRWRVVLEGLGPAPGLARLTAFRAAGQSISTLVPSGRLGGDPLRAWLLAADDVPAPGAIASVAVDRALELGAGSAFAVVFAWVLVQHGVPMLRSTLLTMLLAALALGVGMVLTARRLRQGDGLVTAVARGMRLHRLRVVRDRMATLQTAEEAATRLVEQPRRLGLAFGIGVGAGVLTLVEYWLLLSAFGLPATPVAVVAAIFATGAAHSMPVPAGIGVLEGGQMWLFGMLGHPPDVGLAVGLAVRLRELCWVLPGLVVLGVRTLGTVSES